MKKASFGGGNGIRLALAVGAISLLASQHAAATNLFWSGNGTTQGGAGTWNTTTARWATAAAGTPAGTYGVTWNNANTDSAEFGGTAGLVNLAGPITVNLITTDIAGFNIGNSGTSGATNTINFSGANAGVFTNYAGGTTTINAVMNGTLVKSGAGRLEMGNIGTSQATTNKYVINGGAITTASIARIGGPSSGGLVQDFMTFNGGGWGISTGNQDTGTQRGITIKSGGAFFGQTASTINLTLSSKITGSEGGNLTLAGSAAGSPFAGNFTAAAVTATLNSTLNDWDGGLVLNGPSGTAMKLGASGVVPDTAVVTISAAGNTFDLSGFDETVKSIAGTAGTVALGTKKLTLNNPAGESSSSVLTGTAGSQLIKNGSGALSLTGSSTGFSGEILLNNGTLGIGGVNSLGSNAAGPTFQVNGGKISNTSATGRTMSANLKVNLNSNLTADDSLAATQGQINFTGVSTMVGGNRTFTINGATTNIGFADLREDVAGRSVTKEGTGIIAFTGTAVGTAFTGDVNVNAGKIQVTGTSIIGTGNNLVKLNGGTLNSSASRTIASDPITNPINVTDNSAITTTSTASSVNMAFTSNSFAGTAGKTLTFRNDGADGVADTFKPRLMGSGFDFQAKIAVDNGTTGKTQLEFANTGATIQTFSGDISGNGSLYRTSGNVGSGNGGTTELKGNNTYSGGTTVDEGTLLVNNTVGSGTGTGDVTVGASGKLRGNGTISGNVISTGSVAAGNSIGTLNIGGSLTLTSGTFDWEFSSGTVTPLTPMAADLTNVGGALDLGSLAVLSVANLGTNPFGVSPSPFINGTRFTVLSYSGALTGTFFNASLNNNYYTLGGQLWRIKYDDTPALTVNGGAYAKAVTLTAVPEASTFFVIGLGGVFAFAAVRLGKRLGVNVLNV